MINKFDDLIKTHFNTAVPKSIRNYLLDEEVNIIKNKEHNEVTDITKHIYFYVKINEFVVNYDKDKEKSCCIEYSVNVKNEDDEFEVVYTNDFTLLKTASDSDIKDFISLKNEYVNNVYEYVISFTANVSFSYKANI